jgi:hypothetical protein
MAEIGILLIGVGVGLMLLSTVMLLRRLRHGAVGAAMSAPGGDATGDPVHHVQDEDQVIRSG